LRTMRRMVEKSSTTRKRILLSAIFQAPCARLGGGRSYRFVRF
jgi:hypothetical protein